MMPKVLVALGVVTFCGVFANVGLVHQMQKDVDHIVSVMEPEHAPMSIKSPMSGTNTIETYFNCALDNGSCADKLVADVEPAGGNVTVGYAGSVNVGTDAPIKEPYYKQQLCPVNVHWHLGAEHLSVGQYDETGS